MKIKSYGFSLVEMQMSLVVAAILVLIVGSMSQLSTTWHSKTKLEANLFADISYGLRLIKTHVRSSDSISQVAKPTGTPWRSDKLVVDNTEFGIYRNGSSRDLVYIPDKSNEGANQEKILSVADPSDSDTNLLMTISSINAQSVTLTLSGKKDNMSFNIPAITISRRSS